MDITRVAQTPKNTKVHPSWILIGIVLTLLLAGMVWLPTWTVPQQKHDRLPSLSPTSHKVIMVVRPQAALIRSI